jgi:hypothetical protein
MAFQKPMSKAKIRSIRLKRASRAITGASDVRAEEKTKKRKATRKAAKRKAFAKQVAREVVKLLPGRWDRV